MDEWMDGGTDGQTDGCALLLTFGPAIPMPGSPTEPSGPAGPASPWSCEDK